MVQWTVSEVVAQSSEFGHSSQHIRACCSLKIKNKKAASFLETHRAFCGFECNRGPKAGSVFAQNAVITCM